MNERSNNRNQIGYNQPQGPSPYGNNNYSDNAYANPYAPGANNKNNDGNRRD